MPNDIPASAGREAAAPSEDDLLALAGLGTWRVNLDDGEVSWSRLTRELHEVESGYVPSLDTALAFYPPSAQAALRQALERSSRDGTPWDLDLPFRTARGRALMVRVRGCAVPGPNGRGLIYGIVEDITAREAHQAEHARLALVVEQMTTPVIITDAAARTEWVNEAFVRATGYSLEDLQGRTPGSVLQGPQTEPGTVNQMRRAIAAGEAFHVVVANHRKDGSPYWVEIEASPILGPDGTVTGFIAVENDITARRRAEEEALAEIARRTQAETLLREIIDTLPSALYVCDEQERIILWNAAYAAMFPSLAEVLRDGTTIEELIRSGVARGAYAEVVGPDTPVPEREGWITDLANRIRSASPDSPSREIPLPCGRWAQALERRTPSGHIVSLRTDITALKRAMAEVEAAAEAKSMFLARMSHELRTPLNAILGFAQLLLADGCATPGQREQLHLLHDAGAHLRDLVNGLLDLAKVNSGKLELELAPLALLPLLEGCAELLGPEAQRKDVALVLDCAPELPAVVEADATRLRQMVLNLLSNAVKVSPHGAHVTLRAALGAGGSVRIEVQDHGPGVPEERRTRLFQDFTQLGRISDTDSPGTGLGLAITAQLAALMDGRVGVESMPGQGATFWLDLPLRPAILPAPTDEASREARGSRPLRLLVADDVAANRILMRTMLGAAGHVVTLVSDGAEALETVQAGDFDAVLMDVRMPVMDGLEATRRIRALPAPLSRIVVIAVTASALPEDVENCRAAGMDAHISKPVGRAAMLDLLERLCAPSRGMALQVEGVGLSLLDQLGPAGPEVARALMEELEAVAEALHLPRAEQDPDSLRALLHRGLGASGVLGADAIRLAIEQASAMLRQDGEVAAALAPLRDALLHLLPAQRVAFEDVLLGKAAAGAEGSTEPEAQANGEGPGAVRAGRHA
ncbi:PAS domain S-box protein [Roseococcus sp. SDR]|uniref:PAS domain-containing hybrid sensor histidine kinase/response regulator n=1 Tax=Roseococcus sp. SDR TaxID=2835532 RepID=UPI001BD06BC3|nr:ATP-binding protein [Roseococcus sp. SDR]MBS7791703.1 PAS domain S-box protein [Roseococcus sp. SDR]MBV1847017.1 PAS domain S-box protein [Roseococcus sp. SDR]